MTPTLWPGAGSNFRRALRRPSGDAETQQVVVVAFHTEGDSLLGLGDSAPSGPGAGAAQMVSSRLAVRRERLYEPPDERQRLVGDLPPTAVDDQAVAPVRHLDDLGDTFVLLLLLVRGVRDRERSRIVLLPCDEQERSTIEVLRIDLRLRPGIEVRSRRLEERRPGRRDREGLVELVRLLFADGVRKAVAELLVGERHRPPVVGRVGEHR